MARKNNFAGHHLPRRTKSTRGLTALCACITAAALLFGSAFSAANEGQGRLEIRIKDHREAIADFSRLTLKIGKIAISPKPGLAFWKVGWQEFVPAVPAVDLTKYTGAETALIFNGALDAGAFDGIQLKLAGIEGVLKKAQRQAKVKNALTPIKLPFTLGANGETVIVLDLVVLDMADHPPRGYELAIKGYELYVNGKLADKVPPG